MNILGVIPARGGSQRIKGKNTIDLCGKLLIEYTIDAAKESMLDDYVISTDDDAIYTSFDNTVPRSKNVSGDVLIINVLQEIIKQERENVTAIMLLQPTSPLRTVEDINKAILLYNESRATSLYTGYNLKDKTKDAVYNGTSIFQRNGAIFITSRELIEQGKIWDENVFEMEMPEMRSVDIDTYEDLLFAEYLIKGGILNGKI